MKKVAVVYWSGTGNTQVMAESVEKGAKEAGAEVCLYSATEFVPDLVNTYDAIAFGCPSMGAEVLEESKFQPMWDAVQPKLTGKKIALFGSYGWGDGEWMRSWAEECTAHDLQLACDFVIFRDAPDEPAKEEGRKMGAALAE